MQTELNIAFGSDFDQGVEVITETISGIEGILPDLPIQVLLIELGDSAMKYRLRWWIDSYVDSYIVLDEVHKAVYAALDASGIEMPFTTYDVNLKMENGKTGHINNLSPNLDGTSISKGG